MLLKMRPTLAAPYKSWPQKVRVISEDWAQQNLYCPACPSETLARLGHNTKSSDFRCPSCASWFQLKSARKRFGNSILDGAYATMCSTIEAGNTPSMFMLHYDLNDWVVRNLSVIPSFAFSLSCIKRRNALSEQAQRKFYVGCYIMLTSIPSDAHVEVVANGITVRPEEVRRKFNLLRPISALNAAQRGWTLDVLNVVRGLKRDVFTLSEVLESADELAQLHPKNKHVRDKVRQQLQRLRDLGLLEFVDNKGTYRLKPS